MSQNNNKWGKRNSVFTHPHPHADSQDFKRIWADVLEKNPGAKHLIRPDYQHNYYDPPLDVTTAEFIHKINSKFPLRRLRLLRKFLPTDLYQYKSLVAKLPYSQLQQLREQVYISRIGNMGSNDPCTFSRQHWVYRVTNGNEIVTSDTVKQLPTSELIRWYQTAVNNLYVDSAEEEYLRYKLCVGNRLPLVNTVGPHNPTHYNPADGIYLPSPVPTPACEALMPMVHNAHRYFSRRISSECERHFEPFYNALVRERDLNESLIAYERLQRCAIGREIRARVMTDKPHLVAAFQFFGATIGHAIPYYYTNWISIRSNPVLEYDEKDCDQLPIFDNQNIPKIKPLLDELRQELILEGKMAPEPSTTATQTSFFSPFSNQQPRAKVEQSQPSSFFSAFFPSNLAAKDARFMSNVTHQPKSAELFLRDKQEREREDRTAQEQLLRDGYQITSPDHYPNASPQQEFSSVNHQLIKSNEELQSDKLMELFNQQERGR